MRQPLRGYLIVVLGFILLFVAISEAQIKQLPFGVGGRIQQSDDRGASSSLFRSLDRSEAAEAAEAAEAPKAPEREGDWVAITGEVLRPGEYPLQPGMRIKHLIRQAGGLLKDIEDVQGQLMRTSQEGDLQVLFFDLSEALKGTTVDNLFLQQNDQVVIYVAKLELPGAATPLAITDQELSPVERLMTGRMPEMDVPLRQFGYDLFVTVPIPESVGQQVVEQPKQQRATSFPDTMRGAEALVEREASESFEEQRFRRPVGDLHFAPSTTDVPVGPDYVVGPGDSLNIVLWGGVEASYQVEVNRNGAIVLPRLGSIQVWGMNLGQLEPFLLRRFEQFYPDFQMAVSLGRLRTIRVFVVGEVTQPGAYTVSALSTMINALFVAGGPTKNGSLRQVRLLRQGKVVQEMDLYNFLLQGDKSQDKVLQSGDTIFVPVIGPVAGVAGNVRRAAIYEIQPKVTLGKLLTLAGGVTPQGYLQRVHVERYQANRRKIVVDLDLSGPSDRASSLWRTRILDGDLVRIFPVVATLENVVQLEGHVVRPGRYELKHSMRLRDLLPTYDAVLPEPYMDYAEIVRQVKPDLRRVLVPFSLSALLAGDASNNLLLQPRDVVRVFAHDEFVDPHLVRISGLVHRPGIYPLTNGMRIRDLVQRAGNVHKFAYLDSAELSRQVPEAGEESARRVEVNLRQALAGSSAHNLSLRDFDHLLVRQIPGVELERLVETDTTASRATFFPLQEDDERALSMMKRAGIVRERIVRVRGEVRFPGDYPIRKGERLSSVLQRAGGFNAAAYLRGALFTRLSVREAQQKRLDELLREEEQTLLAESATEVAGALSSEEVLARRQELATRRQLLERLATVKPEGRLVLRLQPLDVFAGTGQDIELEAGDALHIPQTPEFVNVLGEVYNRTSLIYEPDKDVGYYLERVGGIKPNANEKEMYIVLADGTVMSNSQDQIIVTQVNGKTAYLSDFFDVRPQPGDTIVVPRRIRSSAALRTTRDIVQIIFQSISTIAVLAAVL